MKLTLLLLILISISACKKGDTSFPTIESTPVISPTTPTAENEAPAYLKDWVGDYLAAQDSSFFLKITNDGLISIRSRVNAVRSNFTTFQTTAIASAQITNVEFVSSNSSNGEVFYKFTIRDRTCDLNLTAVLQYEGCLANTATFNLHEHFFTIAIKNSQIYSVELGIYVASPLSYLAFQKVSQ